MFHTATETASLADPSVSGAARPELRIALFTDSFHETNGVGTLCREYAAWTREQGLPFLCAYGGDKTKFSTDGSLRELQFRRGPLSFGMDAGVFCDPFLSRHINTAVTRLREFRPDLVHITGPGDVSILGLWAANLVGVPVFASWHTNLHEYVERRLDALLTCLPCGARHWVSGGANRATLWAVAKYYKVVHFVAAPNREMISLLERRTGRPAFLMAHGVNTVLFDPCRRNRTDSRFTIGYVGRLTPEKNVRVLADLERNLLASGETDFRTVVVGEGSESDWLRANLSKGEFAGPLRGEALATAFANLDVLVFPSLTDTFGLVILEAMSSGVPVIATPETGARVGITHGLDGFLTHDVTAAVRQLMHGDPEIRRRMSRAVRLHAVSRAWSGVFEDLFRIYDQGLHCQETLRRMPTPRF